MVRDSNKEIKVFIDAPTPVKSREISMKFVVNTDNSVDYKGGSVTQDGKSMEVYRILGVFYKRD